MKNIYDVLNHVKVNPGDYEVTPLTELEEKAMKNRIHASIKKTAPAKAIRWTAVAACAVVVIGCSQTAFVKAAVSDILQSINLGHNSVIQMDPSKKTKPDISKYYDKNGKPLTGVNPNGKTDVYDAKGNRLGTIGNGKPDEDNKTAVFEKDLSKAVSQLSFKPLLPKDLPSGYAFEKAKLYKDDEGKVTGDVVDLFYSDNAHQIFVQERKISKATTYTYATDDAVQKTTVNGHTAAISGGCSIDWEADGTSIGITAKGLSTDQLIKLASSMK